MIHLHPKFADTMSNESISQNLTFEQFKAYADRKPSLEGRWIYCLEHVWMDDDASYPEFEVGTEEFYFLTFEDAEDYIRKIVACRTGDEPPTYRFSISQGAVGAECGMQAGASWLYDHMGRLVDYCITTCEEDPYKSAFFGRPEARMRFRKGDIVEVCNGRSVSLAVVAAEGPSVEFFWGLYNRSKDKYGYCADASDDCYYTLDGPGYIFHNHAPALAMMKPRFPVPDDVKEFFGHCLEVADLEECTDRYRCFCSASGNIGRLSEKTMRILFDKEAKRHILVKEEYDYMVRDRTYSQVKAEEQELLNWLGEVRYGKTRLWYIIRDWNEKYRNPDEPELPADTPLDELIKNA